MSNAEIDATAHMDEATYADYRAYLRFGASAAEAVTLADEDAAYREATA